MIHAAPKQDHETPPGTPLARKWDRAAFFDVDGTLVSTNVVHAYAHYVFNRGTIFGTAIRAMEALALARSTSSTRRAARAARSCSAPAPSTSPCGRSRSTSAPTI
jgi:hypothetical protein